VQNKKCEKDLENVVEGLKAELEEIKK